MNLLRTLILTLIVAASCNIQAQSLFDNSSEESRDNINLNGFIRGLSYIGRDQANKIIFPVSTSELGLKLKLGNGINYRAYTDIRYSFGVMNEKASGKFRVPEAWVAVYSPVAGIRLGQQVLKWGNAEFINRMDAFNPRNDLVRSPDIEDRNLGNFMVALDLYPSEKINIQIVGTPVWRSSYMYTDYIKPEEGVQFTDNNIPGTNRISYGIKLEYMSRGFETEFYWFDGFYPMPGLSLDSLYIPSSQDDDFRLLISRTPYRRQIAGLDLSFTPGRLVLRTGIYFSSSPQDRQENDYVPFSQADWYGSIELVPGNFNIIAEYGGSRILEYTAPLSDAIIPGSDGFSNLPPMSPAEITGYTGQLISSFNRLMNYQLKETYHSAGVLVSYSNSNMTLKTELRTLYYFTTREIMLQPSLSYKAYDNIIIRVGFETWQGEDNSIFKLIHKRLNSINISLQANF